MPHVTIDDEQLEQFDVALHGDLIRPDDPAYDDARAVWNGMIDKRPTLIARCAGVADVISTVEILQAYRAFVTEAPPEISTLVFAGELPEEELFPPEWVHEGKFAIMGCYAGPAAEGESVLAPLREFAEPVADFSGVMPYAEFQQLLDEDYPDGMCYYWKSLYLDDEPVQSQPERRAVRTCSD